MKRNAAICVKKPEIKDPLAMVSALLFAKREEQTLQGVLNGTTPFFSSQIFLVLPFPPGWGLQVHSRTRPCLTRPFPPLFVRVAPAHKEEQIRPKKHRIFHIWGLTFSPRAWLMSVPFPRKQIREKREEGENPTFLDLSSPAKPREREPSLAQP